MQEWNETALKDAMQFAAKDIHDTAVRHGWYEDPDAVNVGEKIALMHSELSEALEGFRHGNPKSDKIPDYSAAEEEFADVVIRILDLAYALDLNIPAAMVAKMDYNDSRSYRHGGKKF